MNEERSWPETFREIYEEGMTRYEKGTREVKGFFSEAEKVFLHSIGCSEQELFDFIEDACDLGEPSFEAALLVQAERRDYLRTVQGGQPLGKVKPVDSFPAKGEALEGIAWLPRIIAKARAKLRGELPPDLMYG